jgi:hypothetical protein
MVDVARGSRVGVTYAMEDTWTSLATVYTAYELRVTGIGVNLSKDSFQSQELRSDRHISDLRHGMFNVSGDISVELSYGSFDDLIESAMYSEWETDDTIVTGTTEKSFTLQKHFSDITQYHVFPGCIVNTWGINVTPNGLITSTFNVIGETMNTAATPTISGASAKSAYSPFDSFSGTLTEGGVANALITSIDFSISNNIQTLPIIGSNKTTGLVDGRANITGTVSAYFANSTLLAKFINETESSLSFQITDGTRSFTFLMPRIKYSGGDVPVSGEGPIVMNMPFQALYDSGSGYSLQITRATS